MEYTPSYYPDYPIDRSKENREIAMKNLMLDGGMIFLALLTISVFVIMGQNNKDE
jgi:hypothetical protein